MSFEVFSIQVRLEEFCHQHGIQPVRRLGFGKDGTVWSTSSFNAVKVYASEVPFAQEVRVYRRLAEHSVMAINGHHVPQVVRVDEELGVLEMTMVERPFVLDFASARLDEPFDFSAEVMEEWWERKRDDFGPDWGAAVGILRALEKLGVYMTDVHPGNIGFVNSPGRQGKRTASSSSP